MQAGLSDLLAWRAAAGRGLDLRRPARVGLAVGSGAHAVALPLTSGRGLQFAESRPYQRGDDVRSIDWKVTARQGRPHTKVFATERERPLWIVIDQGASMRFGSRGCYKSVLAARAAAWLGWSGSAGGDRVGGCVFGATTRVLPPRIGDRGVLALLDALCFPVASDRAAGPVDAAIASPAAGLGDALAMLLPGVRTGDRVCVISDFYALDTPEEARRLAVLLGGLAEHGEVALLPVSDPLEVEPPPVGQYPVWQVAQVGWLDVTDPATRQRWRSHYAHRFERLQLLAQRHGWPLVALSTDGDLSRALSVLGAGR